MARRRDTWRLLPGDELELPPAVSRRSVFTLATDELHRFTQPAAELIRFVDDGGVPQTPTAAGTTRIAVSGRVTPGSSLPAGLLTSSTDRRNFKIEISDPGRIAAGGARAQQIGPGEVTLEILSPGFTNTGPMTLASLSSSTTVPEATIRNHPRNRHIWGPNPGATDIPAGVPVWVPREDELFEFTPVRQLDVVLARVPGTDRFRSRYLRLVQDSFDQAAVPAQTLLADWGGNADPLTEILGQVVRAHYTASSGEAIAARATVGGADRRSVRLGIHIVKDAPGGNPLVSVADATEAIQSWFRRIFAQLDIAPRIEAVDIIEPVQNMIVVANATGARASGHTSGGAPTMVSFQIRARRTSPARDDFGTDAARMVGPFALVPNATPLETANLIAQRITAEPPVILGDAPQRPFEVVVVENAPPAFSSRARGPVDIVITDPGGGFVVIDNLTAHDTQQEVRAVRVNSQRLGSMGAGLGQWNAGSSEQRALIHAVRGGRTAAPVTRVDVFVVHTMTSGDLGQSLLPSFDTARPARPESVACTFVIDQGLHHGDVDGLTTPHEVGHILLNAVHVTTQQSQLMFTSPVWSNPPAPSNPATASKRFSDRPMTFDTPSRQIDQYARVRQEGADRLVGFDR